MTIVSDAPDLDSVLRPAGALRGTVVVPSDKSVAHRALIANALAEGAADVELRAPGADILSTLTALRALGTPVEEVAAGHPSSVVLRVRGAGDGPRGGTQGGPDGSRVEVDCGNSGTTMRLLAGVAAAGAATVRLTGDASLRRRPMERIAAPLRAMGAQVRTADGRPPVEIEGARPLRAIEHVLPVASAQVLGAVSLAALAAGGTTVVHVPGPTRDHTERLLAWLGAGIRREAAGSGSVTTIEGGRVLRARSLRVPGDPSSAAWWLVAGALAAEAEIRIADVVVNPSRLALVEVLREMGADISMESVDEVGPEPVGDLLVRGGTRLRGTSVGGARASALIDELPVLAVAMAAADGVSEVRGAAELRVKESDRIATVGRAVDSIGGRVEQLPDGWRIARGRPREARVETHGDHRVAMALAVAAWTGVATSVTLDDASCVGISYPSFWRDAAGLGAGW